MAGGQKKVILRTFTDGPVPGYLPSGSFVHASKVDLMDPGGRVNSFLLKDIKHIAFVRDFNMVDLVDPERIGRRSFLARPRGEGLWVKVTFMDGDSTEGLTDVGLALLDGILQDEGIFLAPPEARANTLRLYVPRAALSALHILGAVTTARKPAARPAAEPQPGLFGDDD